MKQEEGLQQPEYSELHGFGSTPAREMAGTPGLTTPPVSADRVTDPTEYRVCPCHPDDYTDLGNAERLIAMFGDSVRYDASAGKWLVWRDIRWEHDADGAIYQLAHTTIRSMYRHLPAMRGKSRDELYGHIRRSESIARIRAMVEIAATLPGVCVGPSDLDSDPMLFNVLNGTVDLNTGRLRPHDRADMITKLAPVDYDPDADWDNWYRFLSSVLQGDKGLIGCVERMVGYLITGCNDEQVVFVLTGKGSNGKTTFLEIIAEIMGDYAADTPFSTFVERRDTNTCDIAALVGSRMVTASEGDETQCFNESLLKRCSGGDRISCRHLYRDWFTYRPTYKIVFCTNKVPYLRSQDYAMKRRLVVIPFKKRFYAPHEGKTPVRDERMMEKLRAEKTSILSWMVQCCLWWQADGLSIPQVVLDEVDSVFESQDPLAEFIDERCLLGPGEEVTVADLWSAYTEWCDGLGCRPVFRQVNWFSRNLTQRDGIERVKGTHGVRKLRGIGLQDGPSGGAEEPADDYPCIGRDLGQLPFGTFSSPYLDG